MRNAGLEDTQAGIKIAGRNSNNFRYADDITHMAESEKELKSLNIMRNAGLEDTRAGIKFAGRNSNNLRYADDITRMAESEKRTKELLDESERGE